MDSKALASQLDSEFASSALPELGFRSYTQTLQEMDNLGYDFGESNFVEIGETKAGSISHGYQVVQISSASTDAQKLESLRHEIDHFVTFKNWANEQGITLTKENIKETAVGYYQASVKPSLFYFNKDTYQYVGPSKAKEGDTPVLANLGLIDEVNSWIRDDLMRAHMSKLPVMKFGPEVSPDEIMAGLAKSDSTQLPYLIYWNKDAIANLAKHYKMSPDVTLFKLNPSESDLRLLSKLNDRCKSCTAPIDIEGATFCPYCGTEIAKFIQGNANF